MAVYLVLTTAALPSGTPAGAAVNRIEADPAFQPGPGLTLLLDDGRELWAPPAPPPPVPASVTNFQARAVLMQMPSPSGATGRTLFQDVDDALHAEGGVALQAWEYANDVTRDGPLVNSLGARLGMTPEQLDGLFLAAATITA